MDFQTEYDKLTKTIDDTLSTQVSSSLSWNNIPGGAYKVVSSIGGYAWAFNINPNKADLRSCQLPCTGNWVEVDLKDYNTYFIIDIAIDATNIYVLAVKQSGEKSDINILTNIVSGKSEWINIYSSSSTESSAKIFSTKNFLWLTEGMSTVIKKCPKPCTPSNWMNVPNTEGIVITSTTETEIYGMDKNGKSIKTDENMRTGWNIIKGIANNKSLDRSVPIGTDPQRAGTYSVKEDGKLFNCIGDCQNENDINPVDTKGLSLANLSYDSGSNNLWMTTWNPGEKGNIFTQVDKPDYSSILNTVDPLDKQRDQIVKDTTREYEDQTKTMTTNKQIQTVVDFFQKFFGYSNSVRKQNQNQASALTDNIEKSQQKIDKMTSITSKLLILIITLAATAIIYLLLEPLFGTTVHYITIVALGVGIFFTVYY